MWDGISPHESSRNDARSGGEKLAALLGWYDLGEILVALQPMWGTDDVAGQKGARDIVGVGVDTSVPLWGIDRLMGKVDVSDTGEEILDCLKGTSADEEIDKCLNANSNLDFL